MAHCFLGTGVGRSGSSLEDRGEHAQLRTYGEGGEEATYFFFEVTECSSEELMAGWEKKEAKTSLSSRLHFAFLR